MSITHQIEEWKKRLLDLSRRNGLLNFHQTKVGTLKIEYPNCSDFFNKLLDGDDLQFLNTNSKSSLDEYEELFEETKVVKYDIRSDREIVDEQRILKHLKRKSRTAKEEQGVNILFAAFGFLNWQSITDNNETYCSPLLLIPVNIARESLIDPFILSAQEDEVILNPTLVYQMEAAYGLKLPEYTSDLTIEEYFNQFEELLKDKKDWSIDRSAQISTFSFLKINIYHDLTENIQKAKDSCFVQALAGKAGAINQDSPIKDLESTDIQKIDPMSIFQVLDADSSQQKAIEAAKKGISFILQGPPGTGKSQTITNIIAESLAQNKTVLFVSEKEAAINVVKSRLEKTKLADFCLSIHSHKANKKEIISNLYHTATLPKYKVRQTELTPLTKLPTEIETLNGISDDLHKKFSPLDKSIFEANGELIQLEDTKIILFDIPELETISAEVYENIITTILALKNSSEQCGVVLYSPYWNNCTISNASNKNLSEFKSQITESFLTSYKLLCDGISKITFSVEGTLIPFIDIPKYIKFLKSCAAHPTIPSQLRVPDVSPLIKDVKSWKDEYSQFSALDQAVRKYFDNPPKDFDCDTCLERFKSYDRLFKSLINIDLTQYKKLSYLDTFEKFKQRTNAVSEFIGKFEEKSAELISYGIDLMSYNPSSKQSDIISFLKSLTYNFNINESWFKRDSFMQIEKLLSHLPQKNNELKKLENTIYSSFDNGIESVDADRMIKMFRTKYSSPLRIFNKSYKEDLSTINGYYKKGKLDYKTCCQYLIQIRELQECRKWFAKQNSNITKYFEEDFVLSDLSFASLNEQFSNFKFLSQWFNGVIPNPLKEVILHRDSLNTDIKIAISDILSYLKDGNTYSQFLQYRVHDTDTLRNIQERVNTILLSTKDISMDLERLSEYSNSKITDLSIIQELKGWQLSLKKLEENANSKEERLGSLFMGVSTNWDDILGTLNWIKKYNKDKDELGISNLFTEYILSEDNSRELYESVNTSYKSCKPAIEWFNSWFKDSDSLLSKDVHTLFQILDFYYDNIDNLERWIIFNKGINKIKKLGFKDFVDKVISDRDITVEEYLPIFKKRFYNLWLDEVLKNTNYLKNFSSEEINSLIADFRSHDQRQFVLAQGRLYEKLSSQLPDVNSMVAADDQLAILKREYNKKKRLMPLRLLFLQIPMLIQKLKPCLMMSPLSVSLLLQSEDYVFDLVIFDEASQIKPETAIGAIMRGKQIIIAGDTNQLPPTTFFDKTVSNEDYDENLDDDQAYIKETMLEESILSAGVRILPEIYLKWHYRSKNEPLIAFSNSVIYDNLLTTFPSVVTNKDNGLEFVYVSDGVFDRGGRKHNLKEAAKVAELIFEHFQRFPKRSLGVITNSESQVNAIEMALEKLRRMNPQMEVFFKENNEEPFFIKSIESVQGDERDTIIYSVGYGKDSSGKVYNSFGPISQEGGERRLNVAITRAKYNLKLVASVLPEELNIPDTAKNGPRFLKKYIDYAKNGVSVISPQVREESALSFESPFEEAVYHFIKENGYDVVTQVGCAGYRIDLAIKDPKNPERFILGIECDGEMYHSSKSARERDRLRHEVLESMGWRIYRIWSTEWVKRGKDSKSLLLKEIENALSQKYSDDEDNHSEKLNTTFTSVMEDSAKVDSAPPATPDFGFIEYESADDNLEGLDLPSATKYILEKETPIHFNALGRKLRAVSKGKRVTNDMIYALLAELSNTSTLKNEIIDDFVYLTPRKEEYVMRKRDKVDASLISPEELEFAMKAVGRKMIGPNKNSLITETAHAIGYINCTEKTRTRLEMVYRRLIEKNELIEMPTGAVKMKVK